MGVQPKIRQFLMTFLHKFQRLIQKKPITLLDPKKLKNPAFIEAAQKVKAMSPQLTQEELLELYGFPFN